MNDISFINDFIRCLTNEEILQVRLQIGDNLAILEGQLVFSLELRKGIAEGDHIVVICSHDFGSRYELLHLPRALKGGSRSSSVVSLNIVEVGRKIKVYFKLPPKTEDD